MSVEQYHPSIEQDTNSTQEIVQALDSYAEYVHEINKARKMHLGRLATNGEMFDTRDLVSQQLDPHRITGEKDAVLQQLRMFGVNGDNGSIERALDDVSDGSVWVRKNKNPDDGKEQFSVMQGIVRLHHSENQLD